MTSVYIPPEIRYGDKFASYANSFRQIGLEIDKNPVTIKNYFHLPAIQFLVHDSNSTTLDRTLYMEALAYGDPGVLLASPGPSLSGLMLRELGSPEQINHFYSLIGDNNYRTFFALTEPRKGSDANHIETSLLRKNRSMQHYLLNGTKCFFGNGAVADTGIVFARTGTGPVGVRAIWLTPELLAQTGIVKCHLPLFALRGSQLAVMRFQDVEVPVESILGHQKSACENGIVSIVKVFNRLRTGVGAAAIGQAQAVYDACVQMNRLRTSSLCRIHQEMQFRLDSARALLQEAAKKVDVNPLDTASVSLAKVFSTKTAEFVLSRCVDLCTFGQLVENEWILKAYRDVFCWEYMEGTTHIQKKQIMRVKQWNH